MKILLVDDDQMVRTVCANMLQLMQHDILLATCGEQAIEILSKQVDSLDVMLLDDAMPEMDGYETLQKMREKSIRLPVIIISGGSTEVEKFAVEGGIRPLGILSKPFSLQRLKDALNLVQDS